MSLQININLAHSNRGEGQHTKTLFKIPVIHLTHPSNLDQEYYKCMFCRLKYSSYIQHLDVCLCRVRWHLLVLDNVTIFASASLCERGYMIWSLKVPRQVYGRWGTWNIPSDGTVSLPEATGHKPWSTLKMELFPLPFGPSEDIITDIRKTLWTWCWIKGQPEAVGWHTGD